MNRPPSAPARPRAAAADESRLFGLNAVRAAFAARPDDLRKLWLLPERLGDLRELVAGCVARRRGYTLVEAADLERLSGSQHHEGVVAAFRRPEEWPLPAFLAALPPGPVVLLWLDGVGNPHNIGAILRAAAHFGAAGLLLPEAAPGIWSGAAVRVAEGGAEAVPAVRLGPAGAAVASLRGAGFELLATVVRGGESLYARPLPARCVWVLGAEGAGVDPALAAACTARVGIPGSGRVESLNVAAASAVLLAEWARQHR